MPLHMAQRSASIIAPLGPRLLLLSATTTVAATAAAAAIAFGAAMARCAPARKMKVVTLGMVDPAQQQQQNVAIAYQMCAAHQ